MQSGCGGGFFACRPSPRTRRFASTAPDAAAPDAIFNACLQAHGGRAAYARLHDVNVRFDSHWAAVGPRIAAGALGPGLPAGQRGAVSASKGWVHRRANPSRPRRARSTSYRTPPDRDRRDLLPAGKVERQHVQRARRLAWAARNSGRRPAWSPMPTAMFLWGPYFFTSSAEPRSRKLASTADVDRPPLRRTADGPATWPRRVTRGQGHPLHRPAGSPPAPGAVHAQRAGKHPRARRFIVDLLDQRRLAGVLWPTRYRERIDHPVNLPAHQWSLLGFDVNRGYTAADLAKPGFAGRAAAPAAPR